MAKSNCASLVVTPFSPIAFSVSFKPPKSASHSGGRLFIYRKLVIANREKSIIVPQTHSWDQIPSDSHVSRLLALQRPSLWEASSCPTNSSWYLHCQKRSLISNPRLQRLGATFAADKSGFGELKIGSEFESKKKEATKGRSSRA